MFPVAAMISPDTSVTVCACMRVFAGILLKCLSSAITDLHALFLRLSQDALNLLFLGDTNRVVAASAPGFTCPNPLLLTLPFRRLQ